MDNCENYSEAANPDAFCSNWLTFRGKPKEEGVQVDDEQIESDLKNIQPLPIDTKRYISPEEVNSVSALPRGSCTGTLIPDNTVTFPPPTVTTTTSPCKDIWSLSRCQRLKRRNWCGRNKVQTNCQKTCGFCGNNDLGTLFLPIY